jgi:hypothetical protein
MADAPTFETMMAQTGSVITVVHFLKKLPIIQKMTDSVTEQTPRIIASLLTACTTVGLSYHWDPTLGQFIFGGFQTGVAWYVALAGMGWKFAGAITTVHAVYHGAVKNGAAEKIAAAVVAALKSAQGKQ